MVTLENTPQAEKELFKAILPANIKSGIEIGVLNGETSGFFLNTFPELELVGIDPIIPDSMEASLIGSEEKIRGNTEKYNRFLLVKDYSQNAEKWFDPETQDFVFIDGSHHYNDVKVDYQLYLPKVKPGGFIFIHDSRMNRGGAPFHVGPSKLVDEIIAGDRSVKLVGEAFSLTAFQKV